MKYCVIGAGGCGASIAGYMAEAGKDAVLIARGEHLRVMREKGLTLETADRGTLQIPVRVFSEDEYREKPDVIFVCVKGYSIPEIIPFLERISDRETVIIPILNLIDTGEYLQSRLPEPLVTDGCMYISAFRSEPGVIRIISDIFRVVYGVRDAEKLTDRTAEKLMRTAMDLRESHIQVQLSEEIKRDALQKFSMVSPMAACGLFYDSRAGLVQEAGEARIFYEDLVKEIDALASAMGHPFLADVVKTNMDIMDGLDPEAAASVQRDIWAGHASEAEGLILRPLELGKKYGLSMPKYRMTARKLIEQGILPDTEENRALAEED